MPIVLFGFLVERIDRFGSFVVAKVVGMVLFIVEFDRLFVGIVVAGGFSGSFVRLRNVCFGSFAFYVPVIISIPLHNPPISISVTFYSWVKNDRMQFLIRIIDFRFFWIGSECLVNLVYNLTKFIFFISAHIIFPPILEVNNR